MAEKTSLMPDNPDHPSRVVRFNQREAEVVAACRMGHVLDRPVFSKTGPCKLQSLTRNPEEGAYLMVVFGKHTSSHGHKMLSSQKLPTRREDLYLDT